MTANAFQMTAGELFFWLVAAYYAGVLSTAVILGLCRTAADSDPYDKPHGM